MADKAVQKNGKEMKAAVSKRKYIQTYVPGFDTLLGRGIPFAASVLVCGGPGSGKTLFCLQSMYEAAKRGETCVYLSFEESEERLKEHMDDFGWDWRPLEKEKKLLIKRMDPFAITRSVRALLEKAKGELMIDVEPVVLPFGARPDRIVLDSLSAIAAAFVGQEESYRTYLEQLFKLFEKIGATSLLIAETEDIPKGLLTRAGVEEFLADGIIVVYNVLQGNKRQNALEILKMRGASHSKNLIMMDITDKGITVYPDKKLVYGLSDDGVYRREYK